MNIENKKFHFIAIGGVGMSALAKYLIERGAIVSGSDVQESKYTQLLEKLGAKISIGHDKNLIKEDMLIVASSAIKPDNTEYKQALNLGLKIYHRSDILKLISDEFSIGENSLFIGFSGTHGKTTTSGLCSYVLDKAGLKPSFVVGGIIPNLNTNGVYGNNGIFIAELDESDGTIEKYNTDIAVINNLEEDHQEHYKNGFIDIAKTFNEYLNNKNHQKVIINSDDKGCKEFMRMYPHYNYITFGINNADYSAKNIEYIDFGSKFDVFKNNEKIAQIELSILGKHNVYNALAVFAALKEAGINDCNICNYFKEFSGMGRRFQKVCEFNGITIYDDYAHHPSEIKTTLAGIKNSVGNQKRIVALFQPHRYTRLKSLWNEFKTAFTNADKLFVTNVYSAGEDEIENINSRNFVNEIEHNDVTFLDGNIDEISDTIYPMLKNNDIVITLGAGDITKLGNKLFKKVN